MRYLIAIFFSTASLCASPESIKNRIAEIYNFQPIELTKSQHADSIKELDRFWNEVRSEGEPGLEVIRAELNSDSANRYFYFDGASLLVTFSNRKEDAELAARAIEKADFRQLDWKGYFQVVRSIGKKGGNVVKIALKVLEEPKFKIFVPQHFLTIEPDYAILYMIKDVPTSISTPILIEAYDKEKDEEKKKYIVTVLWYSLDAKALAFIDSIDLGSVATTGLKERVVELKKRNGMAGTAGLFAGSFEKINRKRVACLDRVSDEALSEYEDLTKKAIGALKLPKHS